MRRISISTASPDASALDEAARVIEAGGVVALPTDTLYGLAVNPFHPGAVARVFAAKGRAAERALLLIAADVEQIEHHIGPLSSQGQSLGSAFWPGPLTLLMRAPATLAVGVASSNGTVGVRVPAHRIARELCRVCGVPLTATSANLSGVAAPSHPDEVARSLSDRIDLLIDAGTTPGGPPSTIVDVSSPVPTLVRAGAISVEEIRKYLKVSSLTSEVSS
jgi:L-threonylcarbamoyladenylate synthase